MLPQNVQKVTKIVSVKKKKKKKLKQNKKTWQCNHTSAGTEAHGIVMMSHDVISAYVPSRTSHCISWLIMFTVSPFSQ